MKTPNTILMTTILSGFIYFTAHGAPTTFGFKKVDIPQWAWYQSLLDEQFLDDDMARFGEPRHHGSDPASYTNFPSWGLVFANGNEANKVYITNQGRGPLRYLLRRTGTQHYLDHTIQPHHQHVVHGPAVTILCIKHP
ncbi:hypothetical protein PGT21_001701 [Puccinia graminis f. sp. tritici]|nr:hypothetical protein PGT21_001851 [Puccinia graminis f. sp. tritici]KAA1076296.1 hypothetical protein PGT21_001701 [Puccinia graminis f. sp. tritici]